MIRGSRLERGWMAVSVSQRRFGSEMTGKQSNGKGPKAADAKKTGGGTAVGGGINFQAAVTAIVGVHILRGTPMAWLDEVCSEKPVAVWAES